MSIPTRRPNLTLKVQHESMTIFVTLGLDPFTGQVFEVFGSAKQASSGLDYLVSDACVLISVALRHGVTPHALARSLHREPRIVDGQETQQPASVIGAILTAVMQEWDRQPQEV